MSFPIYGWFTHEEWWFSSSLCLFNRGIVPCRPRRASTSTSRARGVKWGWRGARRSAAGWIGAMAPKTGWWVKDGLAMANFRKLKRWLEACEVYMILWWCLFGDGGERYFWWHYGVIIPENENTSRINVASRLRKLSPSPSLWFRRVSGL